MVNVYAQGATSAIMVQENWDDSVQRDVITRFGGPAAVVDAVEDGIAWISQRAARIDKMKPLLLGEA